MFDELRKKNGVPIRDLTSLKAKFDKLSYTKKPIGSVDCPPHVRRVKQIARSMQVRCVSASLGVNSEEDADSDSTIDLSGYLS